MLRAWTQAVEALEAQPAPTAPADGYGSAHGSVHGTAQYRSVWISDLHLGTPGCQAHALLDFLKQVESVHLFLVGDIIDGWQLRRHWYWPQAHNDVIQKLLRKARKGTRVIFIPGNHDEFARRYLGHDFGATWATTSAASKSRKSGSTRRPTVASCGSRTAICSTG